MIKLIPQEPKYRRRFAFFPVTVSHPKTQDQYRVWWDYYWEATLTAWGEPTRYIEEPVFLNQPANY